MINNENSYYSKYLKYKKKYLDLKQLVGGVQKNKTKEDVLIRSVGAALYIKSFELVMGELFCTRGLEEINTSKSNKISQFNNMNIRSGNIFELEKFKKLHSNWESITFGEIVNNLYKVDIEEYCKLYENEFKSNFNEKEGLYGEFVDGITHANIDKAIIKEEEENNVVNLFS